MSNQDDILAGLLQTREPASKRDDGSFKPKFNPKKEFATWVREQFPDLKDYDALEGRKAEIKRAGEKAWEYIDDTSRACYWASLSNRWRRLRDSLVRDSIKDVSLYLERFVGRIEAEEIK